MTKEVLVVEERSNRSFFVGLLVSLLLLFAILLPLMNTQGWEQLVWLNESNRFIVELLVVIAFAIFNTLNYNRLRNRHLAAENRAKQNFLRSREAIVAARADSKGQLLLGDLWAVNQQDLRYYHDIAIAQSKKSFRNSQFAAFGGFGTLIVVAFIAARSEGASAVAASVIGVAGAGLSGFIGATFMRSQAQASAQLMQFFHQPVEISRALSAERFIQNSFNELQDGDRGKVVSSVAQKIMEPSPYPSNQPGSNESPK